MLDKYFDSVSSIQIVNTQQILNTSRVSGLTLYNCIIGPGDNLLRVREGLIALSSPSLVYSRTPAPTINSHLEGVKRCI